MDGAQLGRVLMRIAHEILERNKGAKDLVLVGLRTRGLHLAERIRDNLESIEGVKVPVGALDITLYRDDLGRLAKGGNLKGTEIPFSCQGKRVVLVDDVLFTGRRVRAALEALTSFGRSSSIQLAVVVDRGHRELPIRADFVGKTFPTLRREKVEVRLVEVDGEDRVVVSGGS
ncbi:MAG: bifunctional pyr operon transcriptional regulator/uracil phosphoribosyltransferase PyrR [Nitrospinota bacterium]